MDVDLNKRLSLNFLFNIYTWKKVKEHFKQYFQVSKIPITRSLAILDF